MNEQIKARWVDALRSGFYKKGKYELQGLDNRFDVNGVLCELAVEDGIISAPIRREDAEAYTYLGYVYSDSNGDYVNKLPEGVATWAGVPSWISYRLALKGDMGVSFDQLATWIEENL